MARDFSGAFLRQYRRHLEESFVLKDLKQYRRMTDFLVLDREGPGANCDEVDVDPPAVIELPARD